MAIDTKQRRYSAYDLRLPWRGPRLFPTGAIVASGRAALAGLYSGLFSDADAVPSIISSTVPTGYQNIVYSFQLESVNDLPHTWDITVGALPTGLSLSAAGVISGTPTLLESQTFTVRATNGAGTDTQSLTLQVIVAGTGRPTYTMDFPQFRF